MAPSPTPTDTNPAPRLRWLDVARAIAVTLTALMHLSDESWPWFRWFGRNVVNPGIFGIVLFFLISGFVIPLTLERRRSIVAFAIARFFRLYPLYWFSLGALLGLSALGLAVLHPDFATGMPASAWWNVTMLQSWVGFPDAIGLYWTLGYELGFYVAAALLYGLGLHRYTDWLVALGTVYFVGRGIVLPLFELGPHYDPSDVWKVTFFVGTLWYRAFSQAIPLRRAALLTALFALSVAGNYFVTYSVLAVSTTSPPEVDPNTWIFPYASLGGTALAYGTFIVLFLTRWGEQSRVLSWIGRISYSGYLLHGLLLKIPLPTPPSVSFVIRLVSLPILCELTYRLIELPCISLGHRLSRRLGFSDSASRATIAAMSASTDLPAASASTGSPLAAASAPPVPARRESKRDTFALLAAAVVGAIGGYFAHSPTPVRASFFNFDKETTPGGVMASGWSGYEQMPEGDTFVWCMAKSCVLKVEAARTDHVVRARLFAYSFPGAPVQNVRAFVNEKQIGTQPVPGLPVVLKFDAPAMAWKDGPNDVRFEFTFAEAPKARVPGSEDPRTLSAAFDWVDVVPRVK